AQSRPYRRLLRASRPGHRCRTDRRLSFTLQRVQPPQTSLVRGVWQIVQWISSHVPEESGRWVRNPITRISRWKVFDNLRRSLVEPFLFILFVAGWLGLPGGPLYW